MEYLTRWRAGISLQLKPHMDLRPAWLEVKLGRFLDPSQFPHWPPPRVRRYTQLGRGGWRAGSKGGGSPRCIASGRSQQKPAWPTRAPSYSGREDPTAPWRPRCEAALWVPARLSSVLTPAASDEAAPLGHLHRRSGPHRRPLTLARPSQALETRLCPPARPCEACRP